MLTDGFLWFKDLSSPDPYFILPIIGAVISMANITVSATSNVGTMMRKIRKYMVFIPIITIPIWVTFPVAFNIYWITASSFQLTITLLMRNQRFRRMIGIP
jgi:YidC/Oxa1 family membrane protein insertase